MKTLTGLLSLAIISGGLIASLPAKADTTTYFTNDDRPVLRSYATTTTTDAAGNSVTTTYYKPGTVLPSTVTYTALPSTVTTKLVAAPAGDEYTIIGNTAYLVNRDKRVVIETQSLGDSN
jgi:hypothetical protein